MGRRAGILNVILAAMLALTPAMAPAGADSPRLDTLFARLKEPDLPNWRNVVDEIWKEWSRSGSPAMDLLLERGREAMSEGRLDVAIGHFSAVIENAPDFAEGYNARATAYFQAGLYGPSLADIAEVLTRNPRHFGALAGLGAIKEALGEDAQALEAYRRAHALNPHDPAMREAIGRLRKSVDGIEI